MVHMTLMGLIGVAILVWLIKIRAWELSVTVELPAVKKVESDMEEPEP